MKSVLRDRFILQLIFAVSVLVIMADPGSAKKLPGNPRGTAVPLTVAPATVVGGNQATATITLGAPAATSVEVTLNSLNLDVAQFGALHANGTVLTIPPGSINATFPVHTFGVLTPTSVKLHAVTDGEVAETTLTVSPASVKTLVIAPNAVVGDSSAMGTVTLDGLAPPSTSVVVKFSRAQQVAFGAPANTSSLPQGFPATVNIPPGSSSATFTVNTTPVSANAPMAIAAGVSDGSVRQIAPTSSDGTSNTLPATGFPTTPSTGTAIASFAILAPQVSQLSLNPASVSAGSGSIATVVLTGPTPGAGLGVLVSASSNGAILPTAVTVPGGTDRTTFKINIPTGSSPQSMTIRAQTQTAVNNMTVLPYLEDGSVRTNAPLQGQPPLQGQAGSSTSDGTSNTITLGETGGVGNNLQNFNSLRGMVTATLSITPPPPPTISVQPAQVIGGSPVTITIGIPSSSSSASSITLSSNHPELLLAPASPPVSSRNQLNIAPLTLTVNASTLFANADQTVMITVNSGSTSASTSLLIKQTPPIASFTLRGPAGVSGGQNVIAQLLLVSGAPAPVTVSLTTNHPELVTVPATITVANSPVPTPVTLKTLATTASTNVTVTATAGSQTVTQTITVGP